MTMLDPTANFNGPFRFFDFPAELRVMVYHEVWLSLTSLVHDMEEGGPQQRLYIFACYKQSKTDEACTVTLPEWICVDKTFLKESLNQFYRNCDWMAQVPGSQLTTNISTGFRCDATAHVVDYGMPEDLELLQEGYSPWPMWIEDSGYSPDRIEVMQSAQSDLAIPKQMERSLSHWRP
jgi:hypothetical protein